MFDEILYNMPYGNCMLHYMGEEIKEVTRQDKNQEEEERQQSLFLSLAEDNVTVG